MCLLSLLGGKFNDRAEITIGLTCVVNELLLVVAVGCTVLCVAAGITMGLTLVLGELLLLLLLFVVVGTL